MASKHEIQSNTYRVKVCHVHSWSVNRLLYYIISWMVQFLLLEKKEKKAQQPYISCLLLRCPYILYTRISYHPLCISFSASSIDFHSIRLVASDILLNRWHMRQVYRNRSISPQKCHHTAHICFVGQDKPMTLELNAIFPVSFSDSSIFFYF